MALISQDTARLGNVLKHEYSPANSYCREVVVVNEAAETTLKPGTVLGKVTADGKYKVVTAGAADGSEDAAAVVIEASDKVAAAGTDTSVLAIVRGPAIFAKEGLTLGADIDLDAEKQAVYDALEALGILVNDQI